MLTRGKKGYFYGRVYHEREIVAYPCFVVKYNVDFSTVNQFKARLDKFWMHQDVLYDYTADLTGIGDRSVHVTKDV